jgi:uncharacterized membrane protein
MESDTVIRAWEKRVLQPQHRAVKTAGIEPDQPAKPLKNVGRTERMASLAGGAAFVLAGRQKGKLSGLVLALLGAGLIYRGATGHCTCYQKLGISSASHNQNSVIPAKEGVKLEKHLTINRPASELYSFWRNLTNLPQVFKHLVSVEMRDGNVSHWVAAGPGKTTIEWDAEVFNDHENELIAWRSLPESQIDTAGSVKFEPTKNDRGTVVAVSMKYNPPGGQIADYLASWFGGDLKTKLDDDLRSFKSLMEAREIPSVKGQPQGAS